MLNLNVGVLGHVDSGKTSLARVLSDIASTASFDKNPQSQQRGITLDLGFSSLSVPIPEHIQQSFENGRYLQFTLVDCPGHASLIRTIIGGAQIIDMMLLVIDVTKGIQTQTAECIIIGELTCKRMIIVGNKIDQLQSERREHDLEKVTKKLKTAFSKTIFKDAPIVYVAACPDSVSEPKGIQELIQTMSDSAFVPERNKDSPFLFAVDHCFGIKGQGTIMTGTVLQGSIKVNNVVEIPALNLTKKVKSIQMFRKPVQEAIQGDRIGICVKQFDPKLFERGIVSAPDLVTTANAVIISVKKIPYFKLPIKTKSKFHVSVGYETVMTDVTCFCSKNDSFGFSFNLEYEYCDELNVDKHENYLLLEFEKPVLILPNSLVIGSKLDMDINSTNCRLAFSGTVLEMIKDKNYKTTVLPGLKIFKMKYKIGVVDRLHNEQEIIVRSMFQKETNIQKFIGLTVTLSTGEVGRIDGTFAQKGKIKVYFNDGLESETLNQLKKIKVGRKARKDESYKTVTVMLEFKRYIYDVHKKIIQ